eukprot:2429424-Pleurochrysis_carterae.AAC.3
MLEIGTTLPRRKRALERCTSTFVSCSAIKHVAPVHGGDFLQNLRGYVSSLSACGLIATFRVSYVLRLDAPPDEDTVEQAPARFSAPRFVSKPIRTKNH